MRFLFLLLLLVSRALFAVTVVGTSNRSGELQPCGCQVNQIGGLSRFYEWVERSRAKDELIIVDAGDTFYSAPLISESRKEMEKLRSKVIADAYRKIKVEVFTPGERDLAFGINTLRELAQRGNFKLLATNLKVKEGEPFQKEWVVETKEGKIGFLGLVAKDSFTAEDKVEVEEPFSSLASGISSLGAKKAKKIFVLSHLGLKDDRKILEKYKNISVLGSHSLDAVIEKNKQNSSVVGQPKHEGQEIVVFKGDEAQLVELPVNLEKENDVSKMVRHYHEVRGMAGKSTEIFMPSSSKRPYIANPHKCKTCHEEQYSFWEKTKHSSAILVLYAKKQHLDPECIKCHSLGFREAGGFKEGNESLKSNKGIKGETFLSKLFEGEVEENLDSRKDPERHAKLHKRYHDSLTSLVDQGKVQNIYWGVQCENCHGNRHGHPGSRTQKSVNAQTCVQCHRPPNAPEFDAGWIPKVACPLMKKKGAE